MQDTELFVLYRGNYQGFISCPELSFGLQIYIPKLPRGTAKDFWMSQRHLKVSIIKTKFIM